MQQTTLATHDDYLITLHQAGAEPSNPLVVTFGGQPSKLTPNGFGTGFALQFGWDTIYVAQRSGTQYQGLSIAAFADAILPVSHGRDVVCYGSSLGGYAALFYGGSINARMVAAAPMLPAWPPLNRPPVDRLDVQHSPISETPISRFNKPIVIYDPTVTADQAMMDGLVLPAYPQARLLQLPYAGHTVLVYLQRAGLVTPTIRHLLEHDEIPELCIDNERNSVWLFNRGRAVMKEDPEAAMDCFRRSLALEPSKHVVANLISLHLRLKDHGAAQALIDECMTSDNKNMSLTPGISARAKDAGLRV